MYFELSIAIERSPADVFAFLRDKDRYPQEKGSPVLLLEKTTPGPPGVGTRYREVVQMLPLLPFFRGEILSELTRFEPDGFPEEEFAGAGMERHLAYQFLAEGEGTVLIQRETLRCRGLLTVVEPLIGFFLGQRLRQRLEDMRNVRESGWQVR